MRTLRKEDLYFYMLDTVFEKNNNIYKEKSLKHNKDIKKIFIDLFEHALQQTEENKKLIKNIFINFNTNHALKMLPINKDKMILKLELFDFSKYDINENNMTKELESIIGNSEYIVLKNGEILEGSLESLDFSKSVELKLIHIIDTLLIQSISFAFKNIEEKDKIKEIFIKEINIILNGIERRII